MFNFFKKQEKIVENPTPQVCDTDKGLFECDSVYKIRQYQKAIEEFENISLAKIMDNYLVYDVPYYNSNSYMSSRRYEFEELIKIIASRNESETISLEERFRKFGQELDKYIDRVNILNELKNNLQKEKDKLGIK